MTFNSGSFMIDIKTSIETEEIARLNARRSIVLKNDVSKYHILTYEDLTYKRHCYYFL